MFSVTLLFKRFEEKLAVTPRAVLHVYIPAPHGRVHFILPPPREDIRNSKGKGVQEEAISMGVGFHSSMSFFSRDFETRIIVFIDDLTSLTVG